MHICVMPHMHCTIIENLKQSQKSNSSLTHMIPRPPLHIIFFIYYNCNLKQNLCILY